MQQHLPFTVLKPLQFERLIRLPYLLQQHLPFTVLKRALKKLKIPRLFVATALTVYGIETCFNFSLVFFDILVATALTVYGIETKWHLNNKVIGLRLQQHLPFTVLKRSTNIVEHLTLKCCNSTYRLRY